MAAVGQVEREDAIMRFKEGGVDLYLNSKIAQRDIH
jgi:hypothetical protein